MPSNLCRRSFLLLSCMALYACHAPAQRTRPPATEFRAAWIATVDNIDFPSRPGLSASQLRAELDAIVTRARELRLNALVFQVRPAADALYRSPLEPWSEWLTGQQGKAPEGDFDPLAHLIERCHQNGMQLHAWFNPFRCAHPAGKGPAHESHVTQRAPQLCVRYAQFGWMDPGDPLAAKWSLAVIQDVVRRYDIDGVHVDDYFYPYPKDKLPFPDDASYAAYRDGGGKLGRDDWRRQNIDTFVERMYRLVHDEKPHVMVGISPFGIARPGVPAGIKAGVDQYNQLYADVPKWLREGWLDYLSPQLYWAIDQKDQAFEPLLAYWHAQNPKGRAIWPGLAAYRALEAKAPFRPNELAEQIERIRSADTKLPGYVLYSFKSLRSDAEHVGGALAKRINRRPAQVPTLPWLEQPR